MCLSTLECAAVTLSIMEKNQAIQEVCRKHGRVFWGGFSAMLTALINYDRCCCWCLTSCVQVLLKPLRALCSFQLQHGAQVHHSKEHLLKSGLYDKPLPKNKRKIKRMQKLITSQDVWVRAEHRTNRLRPEPQDCLTATRYLITAWTSDYLTTAWIYDLYTSETAGAETYPIFLFIFCLFLFC